MSIKEAEFKLTDSIAPALEEGKYTITGKQTIMSPAEEIYTLKKDFYIAANTEAITPQDIFNVYSSAEQQGDFSGTLPFIVLNNPAYPWIRKWSNDIDGFRIPWLALLVVSEKEGAEEQDVKYSELRNLKKEGTFFPNSANVATQCKDNDNVHILTIPKKTYNAVMPSTEDLPWLTHAKYVKLDATEDSITEQDGWFSTIIANRFIPSVQSQQIKSTIHLVAVDKYLNGKIPDNCSFVRFVSLYHWSVFSEKTENQSFKSLIEGLGKNSGTVKEKSLKPHYLRTGEKTYSVYRSPLLPMNVKRCDNINGEETYTADGRLIYDPHIGLFDVSYSAAFNLGRLIILSQRSRAEEIVAWRKHEAVNRHLNKLSNALRSSEVDIKEICLRITEEPTK